jgi:HD-like signal output (HDOD) protein
VAVPTRVLLAGPAGPDLDALCRGLGLARPEWEVLYATAGPSAVAVCGALSIDAVVVDTALPGGQGEQLLTALRQQHPRTGRVALVGPDREADAHRTLAHQPPPYPLALAVSAAIAAAGSESGLPVAGLLDCIDDLPSSPAVWTQLRTLISDPDVEIRDLAQLISRDVGLTARVLRLVNSAFVGLRRHVTDVREAITVLGLRTISSIVLSAEVMSSFEKLRAIPGLDVDALSGHGLASGIVARSLLPDRQSADDGFVAGLLQDVGQLALATAVPDDFRACLAEAAWRNVPLHEVERDRLGYDHAQAGAALLVLWQMPEPVVQAVAGTHTPLGDTFPHPRLDVGQVVRLAHCLTNTRWANWRDPGERGDVTALAEEVDRVLCAVDLEDHVHDVGLLLAGELAGTQAALRA